MIPEAREVHLKPKIRKVLEARCRAPTTPQREVKRARIVLLAAEEQRQLLDILREGCDAGEQRIKSAPSATGLQKNDSSHPKRNSANVADSK